MNSSIEIENVERACPAFQTFKGTLSRDFRLLVFSSNNSIGAPDPRVKAFLHMTSKFAEIFGYEIVFFGGQQCH
jgi:hypothetical protein